MYALHSFLLFAEEQAAPAGNPLGMLGWMIPVFILMWFMMIRPAQRQQKQHQAMLAALKKNDEVVAAGGIIGTVVQIKERSGDGQQAAGEDEVTLRVDDRVRLRVLRSSIVRVLRASESAAPEEANKPAETT